MADYPWAVLDIEPTSDVRLIRKAYAGKLRVTRPDEDPEGFQHLAEARDFALKLAPQIELLPSFPMTESAPLDEVERGLDDQDLVEPSGAVTEHLAQFVQSSSIRPVVETASSNETPTGESETEVTNDRNAANSTDAVQDTTEIPSFAHVVTPSEIAQLLQALDMPSMFASTRSRWALIFDRAELAPLESHDLIMALIVRRLVQDLHERAFSTYDEGLFPKKGQAKHRPAVLEMGMVLIDFENHFRVLDEDKVLRRYLPDDDALFLIDALTLACGRETQNKNTVKLAPPVSRLHATPIIDLDFLEAAYRQDSAILDYYNRSRAAGQYLSSFSLFALMFPLAWSMCYRLVGLAWLFGVLLAMMVGITIIHHFGRATEIDELVPVVYIMITLACAFQGNRLRLQELARTVNAIQGRSGTHKMHIERVHRVMHRSRIFAVAGLLMTGACFYLAILYGFVLDPVPL